jgi:hypothetical protein
MSEIRYFATDFVIIRHWEVPCTGLQFCLLFLVGVNLGTRIWREEPRLKVFENRVLRKIFGPKRDDVTVEWRRLQSEELYDLYSSPNIIRVTQSIRMR